MSCYCESTGIEVSFDDRLPFATSDNVLVIFGSRSYAQQGQAVDQAGTILDELDDLDVEFDAIISGGADGADDVAEVVGVRAGVPVVIFNVGRPADRHEIRTDLSDNTYQVETVATYDGDSSDPRSGKGAYLYRNCLMADVTSEYNGRGLAIWDGNSSGTQRMMSACESHGVPYDIFEFTQ